MQEENNLNELVEYIPLTPINSYSGGGNFSAEVSSLTAGCSTFADLIPFLPQNFTNPEDVVWPEKP